MDSSIGSASAPILFTSFNKGGFKMEMIYIILLCVVAIYTCYFAFDNSGKDNSSAIMTGFALALILFLVGMILFPQLFSEF